MCPPSTEKVSLSLSKRKEEVERDGRQCELCNLINGEMDARCESCVAFEGKSKEEELYSALASLGSSLAKVDSSMDKKEDVNNLEEPASEEKNIFAWDCGICTFLNQPTINRCEMCFTPRPKEAVESSSKEEEEEEVDENKGFAKEEEEEEKSPIAKMMESTPELDIGGDSPIEEADEKEESNLLREPASKKEMSTSCTSINEKTEAPEESKKPILSPKTLASCQVGDKKEEEEELNMNGALVKEKDVPWEEENSWKCEWCTFLNSKMESTHCEACTMSRTEKEEEGEEETNEIMVRENRTSEEEEDDEKRMSPSTPKKLESRMTLENKNGSTREKKQPEEDEALEMNISREETLQQYAIMANIIATRPKNGELSALAIPFGDFAEELPSDPNHEMFDQITLKEE